MDKKRSNNINGSKNMAAGKNANGSKNMVAGKNMNGSKNMAAGKNTNESKNMAAGKNTNGSKNMAAGKNMNGSKNMVAGKNTNGSKNMVAGKNTNGNKNDNINRKKYLSEKAAGPGTDKNKPGFSDHGSKKNVSRISNNEVKKNRPVSVAKSEVASDLCPIAKKCGGCFYQGTVYEKQLALKQKQVNDLLSSYCKVYPIEGMKEPLHYRNKVHAVFDRKKDGTIISGVYQEGSHRVVPVESCMIEDQTADAIINDIRALAKSFKIKIYNETSGFGLLRHVLIRRGFATGEVMAVLVVTSPIFPGKNNFVKALLKLHPEITTIVLNINDKDTNMVLGDRDITIYGKGFIRDRLCGLTFRISPSSFYQINPVQTQKLYEKAMELAGLTGKELIIDAYCGIGTIGMVAAAHAREVIGVELNEDAVKDAHLNAQENEVKNISFCCDDAGRFMTRMAEAGEHADVVFMDPPRSGSDVPFLESVVKLKPNKIVYISCNPETQERDLKYLTSHGYKAKGAYPYDLFPYTRHIESVVQLKRVEDEA